MLIYYLSSMDFLILEHEGYTQKPCKESKGTYKNLRKT